ncbi:MAG: hypothetical protein BWK79_06240, partial [Beggiatoa sp. IS2]
MLEETLELSTFCINCLHPQIHLSPCLRCGYDERQYKWHPLYLKPRTLLKNQYIIGRVLGQGGFGITYVGLDKWLQKRVAIKEYVPVALVARDFHTSFIIPLKKQEFAFTQGLKLFIDEARHLAKFDHPHIVRVINFFEENQTGYMVMDYLDGHSPTAILNQAGGRLPVNAALAIVLPILEALDQVHAQHIYHLDVSLQNIRILTNGVPILIDFGAARHIMSEHSRSLELILKHGYSPIEQYSGKGKIGPWTDIYACGALLYLLLSGTLPPPATDRLGEETLVPLSEILEISQALNDAIFRALAVKWEERFQTVPDFKAALEGRYFANLDIIQAARLAAVKPVFQRRRKYKLILLLTIILLLLIIPRNMLFDSSFMTQMLEFLLQKAQVQWSVNKLITPAGDNAYETYQQMLTLDSNNKLAKTGLEKMAKHYENLARVAQEQEDFARSREIIKQGLFVMPNDQRLLMMQRETQEKITQQAQSTVRANREKLLLKQADQQLATLQWEAAQATYREILSIDPENSQAQTGLGQIADRYMQLAREQKDNLPTGLFFAEKGLAISPNHAGLRALKEDFTTKLAKQNELNGLLKRADQQLAAQRLIEPAGDNAYETYQKILRLVPGHLQAQAGISKIADKFEELARSEPSRQKNLILLEKGLTVMPTHSGLLALSKTLARQNPVSEPVMPPSIVKIPLSPKAALPPKEISLPKETSVAPVVAPTNVVQELLTIADQQLAATQLEAAYQTYQNVLTLSANNERAISGLQRLATRYEELARHLMQQGSLVESLAFIDKGLAVMSNSPSLLALREEATVQLQQNK